MIKKLNNVLSGLLIALIIIMVSFLTVLNIKTSPNQMVLISTSLINSITGIKETLEKEETRQEIKEEIVENVLKEELKDENKSLEIKEEPKEELKEEIKEEIIITKQYKPNLEVANSLQVIETYSGKITGYGPDCVGCSGITASGLNVLNGNIYYEDATFGTIRIVAGDKSLPFGSIIKISGINFEEPILAIILDRGGMIGFEEWKHSYFDLLYETEKSATSLGRQDATFELLRLGY